MGEATPHRMASSRGVLFTPQRPPALGVHLSQATLSGTQEHGAVEATSSCPGSPLVGVEPKPELDGVSAGGQGHRVRNDTEYLWAPGQGISPEDKPGTPGTDWGVF